jgi:hypothetical protein
MMQFAKIKEELKGIGFHLLRKDSDDYLEAVILNEKLNQLQNKLKDFLGMPVWPSDNGLPAAAAEIINEFGSIRGEQTLYFCQEGHNIIFAMLWPWQDGIQTTLKMAQK